ncbi:MAG TPA: hypothetical protein VH352_15785 [Pseudonocardiaceae bacterium]|nr:hypothetical protein [Pseudonocardiaceae bacterium]
MAGTGVVPGDSRLRRFAVRLLAAAGITVGGWLLGAVLNAGTAAAAENPNTPAAPQDSGGQGLLGSIFGGLGNTLTGTVSTVTDTLTSVTTTVSTVTTGVVGGLGDVLGTVTAVVDHTTTSVLGSPPADKGTQSVPVAKAPTRAPTEHAAPPAPAAAPVVPAAQPVVVHRVVTSVAVQQLSPATPTVHADSSGVSPNVPLPDPAPQPAPAPAVPVSVVSAGHGCHGPARQVPGAYSSDPAAPCMAASGVRAHGSAAMAGRDQGLPATSPD